MSDLLAVPPHPRVVLAHDYLTQRGGGERVALALGEALDVDEVITSVYSAQHTFPAFWRFHVLASFLQRVPLLRRDPRLALPLLPFAWSWRRSVDAAVVVCSSSGWSHGIRVSPTTRKIVYCHNPPRWLYQRDDYLIGASLPVRAALAVLSPFLRWWDQRAARSVDVYIANSSVVADRIRQVYDRPARIVHPPVSIDVDGPQSALAGVEPGYFLTIGRGRGYKNSAIVADAVRQVPGARLVVLGGSEIDVDEDEHVRRLVDVSDAELRWLYVNARALVSVSFEDFGLTPIEAAAFGTPSLLLRAGGFLDTTIEGVTGLFVDEPTAPALARAMRRFPEEWNRDALRRSAERFSTAEFGQKMRAAVDLNPTPVPIGSGPGSADDAAA